MVRIEAVVEDFLTDKGKGQRGESGNYRRDAGRELDRFVGFLADHEDAVKAFGELDAATFASTRATSLARAGLQAQFAPTTHMYSVSKSLH